jgi:hypothetical protein
MEEFPSEEDLQRVTGQIFVGQAILVAYKLGLFNLISKQAKTIQEIALKMKISERAVQAMVSCSCVLNLVEHVANGYQLTQIGRMYLDGDSSAYYGKVFDLLIQEQDVMSYESVKKAILNSEPQVSSGKELFSTSSETLASTTNFIESLHYKALKPAFYWPRIVDLEGHRQFVDIGGGSGVHSIAACLNNPQLTAVVCERQSVILHTKKYIKDFRLEGRIEAKALDMWNDPFPRGDVYFFGDIFHDWDREKCMSLALKCYSNLPENGKIILHEMLFSRDKTGPFLTSAYNMKMMVWTEGQQFSFEEMKEILNEAGFKKVEVKKGLGNWSIVIGEKI